MFGLIDTFLWVTLHAHSWNQKGVLGGCSFFPVAQASNFLGPQVSCNQLRRYITKLILIQRLVLPINVYFLASDLNSWAP